MRKLYLFKKEDGIYCENNRVGKCNLIIAQMKGYIHNKVEYKEWVLTNNGKEYLNIDGKNWIKKTKPVWNPEEIINREI